jgi:TonB family protein
LLEGTAQVEYSTVAGRNWAGDVQLIRSSGVESLDEAALRFMRSTRVSSNCPGQRFRYDVEFRLTQSLIDLYGPREPQVLQ